MIEVYTTLLGLNIGVSGVAIAAVLVHLEVVTSQYSYRIPLLLIRRNWLFWLTFGFSAITALMAGAGLLRLALPGADLLPFVNLRTGQWADTPIFLVITSALSGLEFILVFCLILRYLGYLPVRGVVDKISKQIKWDDVKLFLLSERGIPELRPLVWTELLGGDRAEQEELEKLRSRLQSRIEERSPDNPFASLIDATSAAVLRHDIEGWRVATQAIKHKWIELLGDYLKDSDNMLLEGYMNRYMGVEIIRQLQFLVELADQEGHSSFALRLIGVAGKIAEATTQPQQLEVIGEAIIEDFLEEVAEGALSAGQESRFERSLEALTKTGIAGVKAPTYGISHSTFRSIGKLAEAFIHSGWAIPRSQIAERQLRAERVPNSLANLFFQLGREIVELSPDRVALDYWAYLSVTAKVIEELVQATGGRQDYTEVICSLLGDIRSIALCAAECGDAKALERACHYLEILYEESSTQGDPSETCETIAEYFGELGLQASARNIPVSFEELSMSSTKLPEDNHNLVGVVLLHLGKLRPLHLRQAMQRAYKDALPPNGVDQVITQFIIPASKLLGDDFGFSFGWKDSE